MYAGLRRGELFESSVILEGSKTGPFPSRPCTSFESSVILEGSKTSGGVPMIARWFESSVILEGSKTIHDHSRERK